MECPRCGRVEWTPKAPRVDLYIRRDHVYPETAKAALSAIRGYDVIGIESWEHADLCEKCTDELLEWMRNPTENDAK